ncbi:MAG: cation diffusion facilitator family transporter [Bacteroidales bacterium]|nr:cation diffusion facilitator family transporter [Bacteroidales bacterium]
MDRSKEIIRTSVIGIVANVFLASFKALVGLLAHSVAIVLDAVNNLTDVLSSVITIIGTKISVKPADREHPFGHGRVEYFTAIIIAVIVLTTGVTSLVESIKKVIHPTEPEYTTVTLVVIIAAILTKLTLGWYVRKQGKKLGSDALIASGADALFDAVITLATLISAGIMLIWNVSLDGYLGVLISLAIIKAGIEMLSSPINQLLGAQAPPDLIHQIKTEVTAVDGVLGVFDIILHGYGPNLSIGSLHVSVPDTTSAHQIHKITRSISEMMYARHHIIMTVGIYSVATGDNPDAALQKIVVQTLMKDEHIKQVHGFFCYEGENRISVDVVPDMSVTDDRAFIETLQAALKEVLPDRQVSIIIDHNYSE